ncbi:MCE family protein [bacterium]|jgi:ABC-type transporter Mla subunit MlaD|nr:MCE family protein [bacterium]
MRRDHLELKVGIVSCIALLMTAALILVVEDWNLFQGDYIVRVGFPDAELLLEGANVNMSGVKIGKVSAMYINLRPSDQQKVIIDLQVYNEHRIPDDASFQITSSGFFGTHYVRISPPTKVPKNGFTFIDPTITRIYQGSSTTNIEQLLNRGRGALERIQSILDHVNDVVGNENTKKDIHSIVSNFRSSSESFRDVLGELKTDFHLVSQDVLAVTSHLKKIMNLREGHILKTLESAEAITANLREITSSNRERISHILKKIDSIASGIDDDGQFKEAMQRVRENFVRVSENVVEVTGRAQDIIENPALETKLHGAIDSATNAANALADIKHDLYSIDTRFSTRALYNPSDGNFESSFYLDTTFKNKYLLKIGLENRDPEPGVTLIHGGIHRYGMSFRAGLTRDKFGLGIEKSLLGDRLQIGLESYDLNDPVHRIFALLRMNDHTAFMMKWDDLESASSDFRIGLHHTF